MIVWDHIAGPSFVVAFDKRSGEELVIRHGPRYELLAKNTLDDGFDASPALVDKTIYMRGYKYLDAIAAP